MKSLIFVLVIQLLTISLPAFSDGSSVFQELYGKRTKFNDAADLANHLVSSFKESQTAVKYEILEAVKKVEVHGSDLDQAVLSLLNEKYGKSKKTSVDQKMRSSLLPEQRKAIDQYAADQTVREVIEKLKGNKLGMDGQIYFRIMAKTSRLDSPEKVAALQKYKTEEDAVKKARVKAGR